MPRDTRQEQLRLRSITGDRTSVLLDVEVPNRLLEKVRALSMRQRLALSMRAPDAIEAVVDELAHLGALTNLELEQRWTFTQRLSKALAEERMRRRLCPECGVHADNGHLFGCTKAGQVDDAEARRLVGPAS